MTTHLNKRRDIRTPVSCPVYYSDGEFHASGMTENLTNHGGCFRGTHGVTVGMELVVLVIPATKHALMIKKATVRWVADAQFGVELSAADCDTVGELDDAKSDQSLRPSSLMTH